MPAGTSRRAAPLTRRSSPGPRPSRRASSTRIRRSSQLMVAFARPRRDARRLGRGRGRGLARGRRRARPTVRGPPSRSVALRLGPGPALLPVRDRAALRNLDVFFPPLRGHAPRGRAGHRSAVRAQAAWPWRPRDREAPPGLPRRLVRRPGPRAHRPSGRVFLVALGIGLAVLVRASSSAACLSGRTTWRSSAPAAAPTSSTCGTPGRPPSSRPPRRRRRVRPERTGRRQPGCSRGDLAGRASRRRSGGATRVGPPPRSRRRRSPGSTIRRR